MRLKFGGASTSQSFPDIGRHAFLPFLCRSFLSQSFEDFRPEIQIKKTTFESIIKWKQFRDTVYAFALYAFESSCAF